MSCWKSGELLETDLNGAASALAPGDDEHCVVTRDRADEILLIVVETADGLRADLGIGVTPTGTENIEESHGLTPAAAGVGF